jgi:hypothetical protein
LSFECAVETVRGGFATPHGVTSVPGRLAGCLYRADGSKVALSERFGGHRGDMMHNDNPDHINPPTTARRMPGRGIYLGHFMGRHYGHFITETLSTFWIFEKLDAGEFDYFLFHPFVFGTDMPAYARFCLDRFGLAPEKIVFALETPLVLDEVIVPQRLLRLNHSADPRLRSVYRRISAAVPHLPEPTRRVYLSRRGLNMRKFHRVVANEVQIEAVFRQAGFEIVRPEGMPFPDQIALYADAAILAGLSGSALHNSVFVREGTLTIELGDPRYKGSPAPTQVLCDRISGTRSVFVPFRGRRFGPRKTMLFDIGHLAEQIEDILSAETVPPMADGPLTVPGLTPRAAWEIAYLCLRPLGGSVLRRVLRRSEPTA